MLSPLLFIILLEALSCEFQAEVPWEELYADDLVIIADSHGRMHQKAADLEGGYREEGALSECREDQDHDLWYRTGPIAELR